MNASSTIDRPKKIWVWLDVSAACNLACRDCYTKQAHAPNLLPPDRFRAIFERLSSPLVSMQKIHLNWRGEPLLNKKLPEVLKIRRKILPRVPLEFHTNGLLLTRRRSQEILRHLLSADLIYVSIDGGRREIHEENRGAKTWVATLQGLRNLLDERTLIRSKGPKIGIYEISYGRPTRCDRELIEIARQCDVWTRVSPIAVNGQESSFYEYSVPSGPCFWAGHALCITATGDVHVCLLSFRPDGKVGNIFLDDLEDILERISVFRETIIREGRTSVDHCRNCRKTEGEVDEA